MKRIISILAAAALLLSSCGEDRNSILKVYNWSDYIDESLIEEFEKWYEEQTGEPVHVVYQTFDINETMLAKIEKGHEDYDVICPSDYIIERMLRADMLLPIKPDFGDTPNYIEGSVSPFIKHCLDLVDGGERNANDYAVAYMWGTTGILYNTETVEEEDTHTWDIMRNPRYAGKILVKDACRDVYGPVLIYLRQKELQSGELTLNDLMYDSSDKSLSDVENYMKEVKDYVYGWEADFGKEQMTQNKASLGLTWSGDAAWAIEEAAEVGVSLDYTVPDEGSNYWFDGWCIPKYAKNVKAASYFINFLCQPEVAVRNMDEIGYVSAVGGDYILENITDEEEYEPIDLSYFFGPEATAVAADPVYYPDKSVIDRCTMMHDWGDDSKKLVSMWSRVKGDNASPMTYIVIGVTLFGLIFADIYKRVSLYRRRAKRKNSRW